MNFQRPRDELNGFIWIRQYLHSDRSRAASAAAADDDDDDDYFSSATPLFPFATISQWACGKRTVIAAIISISVCHQTLW